MLVSNSTEITAEELAIALSRTPRSRTRRNRFTRENGRYIQLDQCTDAQYVVPHIHESLQTWLPTNSPNKDGGPVRKFTEDKKTKIAKNKKKKPLQKYGSSKKPAARTSISPTSGVDIDVQTPKKRWKKKRALPAWGTLLLSYNPPGGSTPIPEDPPKPRTTELNADPVVHSRETTSAELGIRKTDNRSLVPVSIMGRKLREALIRARGNHGRLDESTKKKIGFDSLDTELLDPCPSIGGVLHLTSQPLPKNPELKNTVPELIESKNRTPSWCTPKLSIKTVPCQQTNTLKKSQVNDPRNQNAENNYGVVPGSVIYDKNKNAWLNHRVGMRPNSPGSQMKRIELGLCISPKHDTEITTSEGKGYGTVKTGPGDQISDNPTSSTINITKVNVVEIYYPQNRENSEEIESDEEYLDAINNRSGIQTGVLELTSRDITRTKTNLSSTSDLAMRKCGNLKHLNFRYFDKHDLRTNTNVSNLPNATQAKKKLPHLIRITPTAPQKTQRNPLPKKQLNDLIQLQRGSRRPTLPHGLFRTTYPIKEHRLSSSPFIAAEVEVALKNPDIPSAVGITNPYPVTINKASDGGCFDEAMAKLELTTSTARKRPRAQAILPFKPPSRVITHVTRRPTVKLTRYGPVLKAGFALEGSGTKNQSPEGLIDGGLGQRKRKRTAMESQQGSHNSNRVVDINSVATFEVVREAW